MASKTKANLTALEKRELRQIRQDYRALGLPRRDIERKLGLFRKFLVENRSVEDETRNESPPV